MKRKNKSADGFGPLMPSSVSTNLIDKFFSYDVTSLRI